MRSSGTTREGVERLRERATVAGGLEDRSHAGSRFAKRVSSVFTPTRSNLMRSFCAGPRPADVEHGAVAEDRMAHAHALRDLGAALVVLGLGVLVVERRPRPARGRVRDGSRAVDQRLAGISRRKRDGTPKVREPKRRRSRAQVSVSRSIARVMPT